jgi:hypothetical protein
VGILPTPKVLILAKEENMKKSLIIIAASVMILVIFASACTPTNPVTMDANNNIAPMEPARPGQGITPVVPSGGTEDDPVINLMGLCSSFENFNIHVLFSPTSLTITQVHSLGLGETISCNLLQAGDLYCTNLPANPYQTNLSLDVCFRGSGSVDETCRQVSMITPGCPGTINTSLISVECLRGSKLRVTFDLGTRFSYHFCAWMGDEHENCSTTSYRVYYPCELVSGHPTYYSCVGDAPTIDVPLKMAFYVRGMNPDVQDSFIFQFDNFFEQANRCILRPTEEPTKGSPLPAQTCEDQQTDKDCNAFGGCYWWSGGGCYSYSEPTFDCHQYDGDQAKCKDAYGSGCTWDDTKQTCNP